jgi:hypothetical protein
MAIDLSRSGKAFATAQKPGISIVDFDIPGFNTCLMPGSMCFVMACLTRHAMTKHMLPKLCKYSLPIS